MQSGILSTKIDSPSWRKKAVATRGLPTGIERIILIRNGKQELSEFPDLIRPLSSEGIAQAEKIRQWLWEDEISMVLTSPATRSMQAAKIVGRGIKPIVIPSLYESPVEGDKAEFERLHSLLNYHPLREYFNLDQNHIFPRYADIVMAEFYQYCVSDQPYPKKNIVVCGHAILLNAFAFGMTDNELALEICLGYGEAMTIAKDGKIRHTTFI